MNTTSQFACLRPKPATGLAVLTWMLAVASAFAGEPRMIRAQAPAIAALHPLRRMNPAETLELCIGLPLRNQEGLTNTLRDLYTPANPHYHHWLTPGQFNAQFGPTEQDYQKVKDFALASGFVITGTHGDLRLLNVRASAADIEKAFHVRMNLYQHPTEARQFHSPDVEPWVDSSLPILSVANLNDYTLPHPLSKPRPIAPSGSPVPDAGSGFLFTYLGTDFRHAYNPDINGDYGDGQSLGLVEFGAGFSLNDIHSYWNLTGYGGNMPLINVVQIDGYDGGLGPTDRNQECSLDIEMAIAIAPHVTGIWVFEGTTNSFAEDILSQMAGNANIKQFSASYSFGINYTCDTYFQQMGAQGQSFFVSSGDTDAFTNGIDSHSESSVSWVDENVTVVGGTTLTTDLSHNYVSETVWNRGGGVGSTGGVGTGIPIPDYQTNANFQANGGSSVNRNVPDVALTAENVEVLYGGNASFVAEGGTSCAAPLWAAYVALANQHASMAGNSSAGFINPKIYRIYEGLDQVPYIDAFWDITSGNNIQPESGGLYSAGTGADLCTGIGTPRSGLITSLSETYGYYWVHDPNGGGGNGFWYNPGSLSQGINHAQQQGPGTTIVLLNGSRSPGAHTITAPCKIIAVGGTSTIGP
jgi:xanthomonalisin